MSEIAITLGVGLIIAVAFVLGEVIFRRMAGALDSRLQGAWRWLVLPATAIITFALFMGLRPFVLDQPPSVPVAIGGVISVALLVACGAAIGVAVLRLLRIYK